MNWGGGLHPARPDWLLPSKRPRKTPGGLIAASVRNVPRREGVPPCLRTAPSFGGTVGIHRISGHISFQRHSGGFDLVPWFRGVWVSHTPPRVPKQCRP